MSPVRLLTKALRRIPLAGYLYESVRQRTFDTVHPTPYGFRLMGVPAVMADGRFEKEEMALAQRLLPRVELFVDVGAHAGLYTCLARTLGCPVIAVEASPEMTQRLLANLALNGMDQAEIFPVAVGAAPGVATLHGIGTGASLLEGWSGAARNSYLEARVPMHTLDALVLPRLAGRKALVKVDVEGFECDVLRGSRGLLGAAPAPLWMVEICLTENQPGGFNERFVETFELFFNAGYQAWVVDGTLDGVRREDVRAWAAARATPHGRHNYLFARELPR